ncbi:ATP-dependent DNA helicase RecQ-like, partial [Saccostrea cucullata]|uniref:ATP-dependent DNA helicase RecQ-like n=1 Tax=Saccostrea cuccullata TaxID=36930 RepID=UPI002ECFDE4D
MATDLENAIEKVLQDFKIQTLKEEQKDILLTALNNKDCMAILPTGYGKSLPYQMLIPVRKQLQIQRSPDLDSYNVGKIIVCSPLIALMQDQVDRLNSIPNVKAVYKGESKDSDHIIAEGKFDYLIASPEVLVGNSGFRQILQEFKVDTIVVDECHTMCTWGGLGDEEQLAFRKWFRHLGELRSMFPSANLLAVSATCNKTIRRTVMKELGLQKECTTLIIRSPDKSNIKYYVKKNDSSIEMSMQFLLDSLELE